MSEPKLASSKRRGLPTRVKMRHDSHFVEDLAAGHGTPVGKYVPLDTIEPDPDQPRSSMGDMAELVSSIRSKGVLEPILVRPVKTAERAENAALSRAGGESSIVYRIISGERRFHAATEAGLYEIPVIEMDVDEEEALEIAMIENLHRKDLTPFEEAEGFRTLGNRYGYTHEQIAGAMSRSRSSVSETLALLKIPASVRNVVQALGIQSKSILLEILKEQDEPAMVEFAEKIADRGLTRADVRRGRDRREDSGRAGRSARSSGNRGPYVFKFKSPDKTYDLAVKFRKGTVERKDLIGALEKVLADLRKAEREEP